MAKRTPFNADLDITLAQVEAIIDDTGTLTAHGTVLENAPKGSTRFRFVVAQYNGGVIRLRRYTVVDRKKLNEDGSVNVSLTACHKLPLHLVPTVHQIEGFIVQQYVASLAA